MDVKILTGEDVTNVYKYPSVYTASSMTGVRLGELTRLYEDNPDKVGMLVSYNEEGVMTARGLLWNCDDGSRVLDVIYGRHSGMQELFEWADENNVVTIYDLPFDKLYLVFQITMEIKRNTLPFLDTFHYGKLSKDHKTVILHCYMAEGANIILTSHEGYCYVIAGEEI